MGKRFQTIPFAVASAAALLSALSQPLWAAFPGHTETLPVPTFEGGPETVLSFDYSLRCANKGAEFPGITGSVLYDGRVLRFELLEGKVRSEIRLTAATSDARVSLDPSAHCDLLSLKTAIENEVDSVTDVDALARLHSPYLVVRPNQVRNRITDLPLILAYSALPRPQGFSIRYTLFFTDEDSIRNTRQTDAHMAKYGRRSDIEWIYQVDFDSDLNVLARTYQGGIIAGIGHSTREFKGSFLAGGTHPILYDITDHNVFGDGGADRRDFSDRPIRLLTLTAPNVGYALVPRDRIEFPDARELIGFTHPWFIRVSDLEQMREGKLSSLSTEYLYVLIEGSIRGGRIRGEARFSDGRKIKSGDGKSGVAQMGENLWGRQSLTALPLGDKTLDGIGSSYQGEFRLRKASFFPPRFEVDGLRFFRLKANGNSYSAQELTERFHCVYLKKKPVCVF